MDMDNIDKNNRLKEECFSYKVSKELGNGKWFICI